MALSSEPFPYPLIALERTDSTNRYLNELCDTSLQPVAELTTVCADYQTAGKGQRGNSWEAAEGRNLLFSFVLYPTFLEAGRQFILSQVISLSIKEALDGLVEGVSIKWPNDIYWQEKKLCGILIENDLQGRYIGRSVAGVGLNVNQERFLSDAPNPVSLKWPTYLPASTLTTTACGLKSRKHSAAPYLSATGKRCSAAKDGILM